MPARRLHAAPLLRRTSSAPRSPYGTARRFGVSIAALFVAALVAGGAAAQPNAADSSSTDFDASFRVFPAPIWSGTAGFAAGVGYEIENGLVAHDRFLLTAKPGQHRGRYTATYFAGDPDEQAVYGLASGYYETTGRQWYYGVGPSSSVGDQIAVEKELLDVEVRFGIQALGRRLFVQPTWAYHRHHAHEFSNWEDGAVERLSPSSRRHLDAALGRLDGSSSVQHGTSYGLDAGIDWRDRPVRTRRGILIQASARRYAFQEPGGLEFDRYELALYGYLPVGWNVLSLRTLTRRTEADGDLVVPFYLLPSLDGRLLPGYAWNRFFGNDLFVVTAEYAVALFQLFDFAAMDGLFSIGAGSVYDDIFEQFEGSIAFDDIRATESNTYPLRPSVAIGFHLQSFSTNAWNVRALLGWGTEGIRLVKFGFVRDLMDVELNTR